VRSSKDLTQLDRSDQSLCFLIQQADTWTSYHLITPNTPHTPQLQPIRIHHFLSRTQQNLSIIGSQDEIGKGKYGSALGQYAYNSATYKISLCQAPCSEPLCCCVSVLCFCPVQVHMRRRVLNHVEPGSGWSNYICCQGQFGGCCCIQPGSLGESTCPVPCMCLEACCCPGAAVSASTNVIRQKYSLGLDEDDVRLIRCNNCLFFLSAGLSCVAMITDCEADDFLAAVVNCISDVVFLSVSGCMTAQMHHEMKARESSSPDTQRMLR